MNRYKQQAILAVFFLCIATSSWSFCGFFVAKADAKLFNKASRVVIARQENRTILTMSNDYQGEAKDFAIVVPVPVVLDKSQVHIGDPKVIERLDAYSSPRLVEYFDPDPCMRVMEEALPAPSAAGAMKDAQRRANSLGVTIEARFTVGEYDILILGAKESSGLETWLRENGYRIPAGAAELLQPYIRQNMKFFVAKVNLKEFERTGFQNLRPIQMAYESPKFMLPIRLGMINAQTQQDLVAYILSPQGRAETTNYRTVKIPSDMDVPLYIKDEFSDFYRAMFQRAYEKEGKNAVFLEYAWDMNWCDPCAADPLTPEELRQAGVFWTDAQGQNNMPGASNVYITRLHVRYGRAQFPEDLMFQTTPNRENYQGRYILRHPFEGEVSCKEGTAYKAQIPARHEQEAQTLANLTGWDINSIRKKMGLDKVTGQKEKSWWERVFGSDKQK
jgi:hypothetical protein